ncbi:hypothetical protein BASA60_004726 [Batrachochytrium salamandrivorans]|nr:hypothetical protein BASA60_004726 [Batrachochytrium salamandrivorans]
MTGLNNDRQQLYVTEVKRKRIRSRVVPRGVVASSATAPWKHIPRSALGTRRSTLEVAESRRSYSCLQYISHVQTDTTDHPALHRCFVARALSLHGGAMALLPIGVYSPKPAHSSRAPPAASRLDGWPYQSNVEMEVRHQQSGVNCPRPQGHTCKIHKGRASLYNQYISTSFQYEELLETLFSLWQKKITVKTKTRRALHSERVLENGREECNCALQMPLGNGEAAVDPVYPHLRALSYPVISCLLHECVSVLAARPMSLRRSPSTCVAHHSSSHFARVRYTVAPSCGTRSRPLRSIVYFVSPIFYHRSQDAESPFLTVTSTDGPHCHLPHPIPVHS